MNYNVNLYLCVKYLFSYLPVCNVALSLADVVHWHDIVLNPFAPKFP